MEAVILILEIRRQNSGSMLVELALAPVQMLGVAGSSLKPAEPTIDFLGHVLVKRNQKGSLGLERETLGSNTGSQHLGSYKLGKKKRPPPLCSLSFTLDYCPISNVYL